MAITNIIMANLVVTLKLECFLTLNHKINGLTFFFFFKKMKEIYKKYLLNLEDKLNHENEVETLNKFLDHNHKKDELLSIYRI